MYSSSIELQSFAQKTCFFLNKVHDVFQATPLGKKIICLKGGEVELFDLVKSNMHESYYSEIDSIGLQLFTDPLVDNTKWWEFAAQYLMKYPFFRKYYLKNIITDASDRSSNFIKFCCLSIVYSFVKKKGICSASFQQISYDAKSLINSSNLKYFTLETIKVVSTKFFLSVIFLALVLTYLYGFSTIAPLRVYEPTFFHSLMGSSAVTIMALSLIYFFYLLQKEKILWDVFLDPSIKTDKQASLKLGTILIGCGIFLAATPLALSLNDSDLNKLMVEGKYAAAVKTVQADHSNNPDKQSYLLSQIYFNAYNDTKNPEYDAKGFQEASKYLNSNNVKENAIWAVPAVVREMNERLLGSKDSKYWYTTKNHESRKTFVLLIFLAGVFLFFVGNTGNLKK